MDDPVIRCDDVWKGFGTTWALAGLSCSVPRGSITALLGQNGAGKTTLLRILVGLLRAERGSARVFGRDVAAQDVATRQRIGYVSEKGGLDPRLTVGELIDFTRAFYPRWDDAFANDLLKRLGIDRSPQLSQLSLGQTRKVGMVLNLAFHPELLVLDEPAANLDAVVRREFLEVVLDLFRREGVTVLLSTHLLNDVERIADRVVLIKDGRLLVESGLDELKERVKLVRLAPRAGAERAFLPPELAAIPGLLRSRAVGREWHLTISECRDGLATELAAKTGAEVGVIDIPLEDIFIAFAADDGAAQVRPARPPRESRTGREVRS